MISASVQPTKAADAPCANLTGRFVRGDLLDADAVEAQRAAAQMVFEAHLLDCAALGVSAHVRK